MNLSVFHFINPFSTQDTKLNRIQKITFESIECAADSEIEGITLRLGFVRHEKETLATNQRWVELPTLNRTVLDIDYFNDGKPYPLIADIIKSALSHEADFYIFSNMDIGVQPHFYQFVAGQIKAGYDGLIINRRRIGDEHIDQTLDEIYKEKGKAHPGFDCFVFSREMAERMILGHICVGIPFVGVTLAHNIFAFAEKPKLFDQELLTFHIGEELFPPRHRELYWHNRKIFFRHILPKLYPHLSLNRMPFFEKPRLIQLLKWIMNPSLFTLLFFRLLLKSARSGKEKPTFMD